MPFFPAPLKRAPGSIYLFGRGARRLCVGPWTRGAQSTSWAMLGAGPTISSNSFARRTNNFQAFGWRALPLCAFVSAHGRLGLRSMHSQDRGWRGWAIRGTEMVPKRAFRAFARPLWAWAVPWNSMDFHGILWDFQWKFHGNPWKSMEMPTPIEGAQTL